jgi:hypothetical protein
MPCRDDGQGHDEAVRERERAQERLDRVTQDLCYLCGSLEHSNALNKYASRRIKAWWKNYQRVDTERVAELMKGHYYHHPDDNPERVANKFIEAAEGAHPVSKFHRCWFHDLARVVKSQSEADAAKAEKQKINRAKALSKLTSAERRALGLGIVFEFGSDGKIKQEEEEEEEEEEKGGDDDD